MRRTRKRPELPAVEDRRAIREASGMTQAQLAVAIFVSPSSIAGWERGIRQPRGLQRDAYAKALNQLKEEQEDS